MRVHSIAAALILSGCSSGTALAPCTTEFPGGICLDLSAAGPLVAHQSLIEQEIVRALDAMRPVLNVTDLRIALIADPTQVIPEVGMGGYNPGPDEVRLYANPALPNLETVLESEVLLQLAHEAHHAMRRRSVGYGSTLLQAAVTEGLADHFSLEVSSATSRPWGTGSDAGPTCHVDSRSRSARLRQL